MTVPGMIIFEVSTSPLLMSNDGHLQLDRRPDPDDCGLLPRTIYVVRDIMSGDDCIASFDRVVTDAFIAGYDFATRQEGS